MACKMRSNGERPTYDNPRDTEFCCSYDHTLMDFVSAGHYKHAN